MTKTVTVADLWPGDYILLDGKPHRFVDSVVVSNDELFIEVSDGESCFKKRSDWNAAVQKLANA